ncbi:N-acetylmuramoyl-L-alanine amidase [Nocardia sp. NBC_01499]|uniref:N-acetylmuramoyl-L-alanine amidase n=1 Tax=Nocardia sp. NBC_01499 TaxID=2903597 RepID=UPI00386BEB33
MKQPSIIRAGICSAVTAAVTVTLSGFVPVIATADPAVPELANKLAGKTVFLDPGHQGPGHTENVAKQVSDGRGGTKDCQTTGMVTVNGVPEHTINWNVAQLVKTTLEKFGAQVKLSRLDDQGWGGCIDDRARAANASGAAVAVSIHADSAPADQRGFHLIIPELPIPDEAINAIQSNAGRAASTAMRDAYLGAGFLPAKYASADGLMPRKDIAGPALTAVPDVFIEMGNGANVDDAAVLESKEGQLKHAIAITTGLVGYLLGPQSVTPNVTGDKPAAAAVPQQHPAAAEPQAGAPAPQPAAAEPPAQSAPQPQAVPQMQFAPQVQSNSPQWQPHPAVTEPPTVTEPQSQVQAAPQVQSNSPQLQTHPASAEPPAGVPAVSEPQSQVQFAPQVQSNSPQLQPHPASTEPPAGVPAVTEQSQVQAAPQVQSNPTQWQPYPASTEPPAGAPAQQGQTAPQGQSSPFTQQSPWPGTQQSPTTPGTQQSPTVPGEQSDMSSVREIMDMVLTLLMPLAKSLGVDNNMVTAELINLAYALAAKFIAPAK